MSENDVSKEVIIHSRCSKHSNILKVIDCNISKDYLWIAMEMADGGDLFDKIEPDIGVDAEVAQFYFQQLLRAIHHLHEVCGIAHRDIKPENILLDKNGNLKLADFGLASQFRRKDGTKRLARDQRGSPPYMAPEIIYSNEYYADTTDIWSCGILVFVLLTGETPWELPSEDDYNFREFLEDNGNLSFGPWAKIDFTQLNLLRKILQPNPSKRATILQLTSHPWFTRKVSFAGDNGMCRNPQLLAKKLLSNLKVSLSDEAYFKSTQDVFYVDRARALRATQPVNRDLAQLEHDSFNLNAFAATQRNFTQYVKHNETFMTQEARWTQYVRKDLSTLQFQENRNEYHESFLPQFNPSKLTKFYSVDEMDVILPCLENALAASGIRVKPGLYQDFVDLIELLGLENVFPVTIQIKTTDRKGWNLSGTVTIVIVDNNLKAIGLDRKGGDPLEWRRLFKRVALLCRDIIFVQ